MGVNGNSRLYETLFIVHPDHGGGAKELTQRFRKIVEELGGTVTRVEEWGLRDLAYRIQKQTKGYYILFQYRSLSLGVVELERNMKLTDMVMRYVTVRVEEETTPHTRPGGPSRQAGKGAEESLGKPTP